MKSLSFLAIGAASPLGVGEAAYAPQGPVAIHTDPALAALGLKKPRVARAAGLADFMLEKSLSEPAEALLLLALEQLLLELDERLPEWPGLKLLAVLGTSSGGMVAQSQAFEQGAEASPGLCAASPYFGPLQGFKQRLRARLGREIPVFQVLAACASSAMALGFSERIFEPSGADIIIAGGYDAVAPLVAAGFEALGVTSASTPRPFALERDGLVLGEGAALVALVRPALAKRARAFSGRSDYWLNGFGASSDAAHPTAPLKGGQGLFEAARLALLDSGVLVEAEAGGTFQMVEVPGLLSAHATATLANDAAEAMTIRELQRLFSERGRAAPVHAFKAWIGHSLGAGSLLELLAGLRCLEARQVPKPQGISFEPGVFTEPAPEAGREQVLKLASAFGGCNAALVAGLSAKSAPARPERRVFLNQLGRGVAEPNLAAVAEQTSLERVRVMRLDALSALCATAALELLAEFENHKEKTAVVVGSMSASLEHNAAYQQRLATRGYGQADARRFPATSPNLAAGLLSILFQLKGPCLSVGAGDAAGFEALYLGASLIAAGDAERVLVLVADVVGSATEQLFTQAGYALPKHGALALSLSSEPALGNLEQDSSSFWRQRSDILARIAASGSGSETREALARLGQSPSAEEKAHSASNLASRLQSTPGRLAAEPKLVGWPELQSWLEKSQT